jgi:hypothetical protein
MTVYILLKLTKLFQNQPRSLGRGAIIPMPRELNAFPFAKHSKIFFTVLPMASFAKVCLPADFS